MNGRAMVRMPYALGLMLALGVTAVAQAQTREPTPTEKVAECVDNAADSFVECTDKGGFINDAACAIKYAADAILCAPSLILK